MSALIDLTKDAHAAPAGLVQGGTSGQRAATAELLQSVGDLIGRFVVLPSQEALIALQLFVLHTWAIEAAHATPYLAVESAERQSGNS
jgi:hypothetical protein